MPHLAQSIAALLAASAHRVLGIGDDGVELVAVAGQCGQSNTGRGFVLPSVGFELVVFDLFQQALRPGFRIARSTAFGQYQDASATEVAGKIGGVVETPAKKKKFSLFG